MPHTSEKELKKETLKRIYSQFTKVISEPKNKYFGKNFADQFFTETEKIMLAKRLAIILMLSEDFSFNTIERVLLVSSSTINKIRTRIDRGDFSFAKEIVKDKKLKEKFWVELEVLLRAGLPPMGKGRWKFLDDLNKK